MPQIASPSLSFKGSFKGAGSHSKWKIVSLKRKWADRGWQYCASSPPNTAGMGLRAPPCAAVVSEVPAAGKATRGARLGIALFCLALLEFAACGGRSPGIVVPPIHAAAPLSADAIFCPEEYLKWSLRWNGIEAASTQMMSGKPGLIGGERAIIVYSLSHSSELAAIFREVREELSSQVSLEHGRPLRNESSFSEDGSSEALEVEFTRDGYEVVSRDAEGNRRWKLNEAELALDVHSLLARLRVWEDAGRSGASALVQNGRRHYRVDLAMGGKEVISTPSGKTAAIRIHGKATRLRKDGKVIKLPEAREFTLWRSDDARFLPLRFEIETRLGPVRGTLVEFRQSESTACVQVKP